MATVPISGEKAVRLSGGQNSTPAVADVSIICVNWNSVDYMRECIRSIREFTHGLALEIIVVDNASPDGKAGQLRNEFPEITLIESKENLGFSRANNLGFRHSTGNYLLFLNPGHKTHQSGHQSPNRIG